MADEAPAGNVIEALARCVRDVGAISKGRTNKQDGYGYRGIDDALSAVSPVFATHGVVVVPTVVNAFCEPFDLWTKPTEKLTLHVEFTVYGPAGTEDCVRGVAVGEAIGSQATKPGVAMSYAFKTFLFQLLSIPTDDPKLDAEHDSNRGEERQRQDWWQANGWPSKEAHDEQLAEFRDRARALPEDAQAKLKEAVGGKPPYTAEQLTALLDAARELAAGAGQEPFEVDSPVEGESGAVPEGRGPDVEAEPVGADDPRQEADLPAPALRRPEESVADWLARLTDDEIAALAEAHGLTAQKRHTREARLVTLLTAETTS